MSPIKVSKGDRVTFPYRGVSATGTVKRVKKDGTITVKPDSEDVNEGAWCDVDPSRVQRVEP